jgi:hypothetical protein
MMWTKEDASIQTRRDVNVQGTFLASLNVKNLCEISSSDDGYYRVYFLQSCFVSLGDSYATEITCLSSYQRYLG